MVQIQTPQSLHQHWFAQSGTRRLRPQLLRDDLGCDDLEWERGRAWAYQQAMGAIWYYIESNPPMHRMGQRTLERILADGSRTRAPRSVTIQTDPRGAVRAHSPK